MVVAKSKRQKEEQKSEKKVKDTVEKIDFIIEKNRDARKLKNESDTLKKEVPKLLERGKEIGADMKEIVKNPNRTADDVKRFNKLKVELKDISSRIETIRDKELPSIEKKKKEIEEEMETLQ